MNRYVRFWSQEVFGDMRNWAVPGSDLPTRRARLVDYNEHVSVLSEVSPPENADMKSTIRVTDAPLANASWAWASGYGNTVGPLAQMAAFVSAEVYALRNYQGRASWRDGDAFGFSWAPQNLAALGLTSSQFTTQSAGLLDRLAAAIHDTDSPSADPGAAAFGADGSLCASDIAGASFNLAWRIFGTWSQPFAGDSAAVTAEDTPVDIPLVASDPDGDALTYTILAPPQHGTLVGDGAMPTYTPAADFNGTDSFTFQVSDGFMTSRVATVLITVTPVNDAPVVTVDAAPPVDETMPVTLTAHATDVEADPITYTWATNVGLVTGSGSTATFVADDGPAVAHVTVTADDGNGGTASASVDLVIRNLPPTASAGADTSGPWGIPVSFSGSATDPSATDTTAGFAATWDFGDGSAQGHGFSVSHAYADPGTYTATLTAADKDGGKSTATATATIGARPSTVAYAGSAGLDASSANVAVRLADALDPSSARLAGHAVTIGLGTLSCTATTDTTGVARCAIDASTLPLGPSTLTAAFAGDDLYGAAAPATAQVVLYELPAGGVFVVGDARPVGYAVFSSPVWWLLNRLSSGWAPASFKGFATSTAPACGADWTAPAGLDHPPKRVPAYMAVVVTGKVTKSGPTIHGNTVRIVVVHTDGYYPVLGGWGTVVATVC